MDTPKFMLSKSAQDNGTADAITQLMFIIRELEKRVKKLEGEKK